MKHRWVYVRPPGMYETEYKCIHCGDHNMESADNPETKNPIDGCSGRLLDTPTCNHCGGQNIQIDAYASWNPIEKDWELSNTFDPAVCETCGGECFWHMEKIKPVEPCKHEFISADNAHVKGASICRKCKIVMATSDALALEQKITDAAGLNNDS